MAKSFFSFLSQDSISLKMDINLERSIFYMNYFLFLPTTKKKNEGKNKNDNYLRFIMRLSLTKWQITPVSGVLEKIETLFYIYFKMYSYIKKRRKNCPFMKLQ